jgi:hypothetical protein
MIETLVALLFAHALPAVSAAAIGRSGSMHGRKGALPHPQRALEVRRDLQLR